MFECVKLQDFSSEMKLHEIQNKTFRAKCHSPQSLKGLHI